MKEGPVLELAKVSKQYEGAGGPVPVLKEIDLHLGAGESVAIVGPSGSGKSTLLQIMGTLDRPSSGRVIIDGRNPNELDERELAAMRNQKIGFVFQAHHLLPQCTLLENVLVPVLAMRKRVPPDSEERGRRLLDRVGLGGRLSHRPGELSGGERQRTAVVRALINGPDLLLADEPTGALDHHSAENLAELLVQLNQEERVTLVVVTHALDLARRMGQVLELRDGRLSTRS